MQYFKDVKNLEDLKNIYKELCKKHHPDLGGDTEIMKEINTQYSKLLKKGNFDFEFTTEEIEEALRDIIEKTISFEGLIVEICGRWVWFTGNTYGWKEQLNELGCHYSGKKKAWYWRPEDEAKKGRHKPISLVEIRSKYGSKTMNDEAVKEKKTITA